MLDINYVEANYDEVNKRLKTRQHDYSEQLKLAIQKNKERKEILIDVEKLKADKNDLSKQIGELVRAKKNDEADEIKKRVGDMKTEIDALDEKLKKATDEMIDTLRYIPNLPDEDVEEGKDDSENHEIRRWGDELIKKQLVPHWDIATKLGLVDFEMGPKLSGSRFVVYTGKGSKMVRALADIMISTHEKAGFTEYGVPFIVNREIMQGTGQLPKFEEDMYKTGEQYLIPTAEVPLTNMVVGQLLDGDKLPLKFTAFTQCFREEAGSAGRDTKGLIRLHQFNKVEMVKICKPEDSDAELESLTNEAEKILQMFNLPYRVVRLCTGDLGFSAAKCYDLEVWLPSQNTYREISSCSNDRDFQARNMMTRYRKDEKTNELVNTLNGSGLAVDRLFAAILENYWDGEKLVLPEPLRPYFNNEQYFYPVD